MIPLKHALCLPAILVSALVSLPAQAQVPQVSCTVSVGSLNAIYSPDATTANAFLGNIGINCSKPISIMPANVNYTIALSTGASGSYAPRKLVNGNFALNYNLYTTLTYNQTWGNGAGETAVKSDNYTLTNASPSASKSYAYYGLIPAGQNVPPGDYIDTIMVTLTY